MNPKIVVVAGGLATRMGPVTEEIPKTLLEVNGKPLLQHQVEFFKKNGFYDFVFCIAHLAHKVKDFFKDGSEFGVNIVYSEDKLLGTAGAVKLAENSVGDVCIVFYGDNLTTMNFDKLLEFHESRKSDFTVVVTQIPEGKITSSLLTLDEDGKMNLFIEKPTGEEFKKPGKIYYNQGIYVMNKNIFSLIPEGNCDFGHDVIPALSKRNANSHGYPTDEFFREIGRPEKYEQLKEEFKGKIL